MESLDIATETVKVEEQEILDLPPTLEPQISTVDTNVETNISENHNSNDSSDAPVIESALSTNDYNTSDTKDQVTHSELILEEHDVIIEGKVEDNVKNIVAVNQSTEDLCGFMQEEVDIKEDKVFTIDTAQPDTPLTVTTESLNEINLSVTNMKTETNTQKDIDQNTDENVQKGIGTDVGEMKDSDLGKLVKDAGDNTTGTAEKDSEEDTKNLINHDSSVTTDIDVTGGANVKHQALLKSIGQDFLSKEHPSDITDANLSKLVDGNSEIVVLTVETVNESNETTQGDFVVMVHEGNVAVDSAQENFLSLQGKEDKKSEITNDEFDLIDYSQESDGTIIEVISTEVIDAEGPETLSTSKEHEKGINFESSSKNFTNVEDANRIIIQDNDSNIKENMVQEKFSNNEDNDKDPAKQEQSEKDSEIKTEECISQEGQNMETVHKKFIVTPTNIEKTKQCILPSTEVNKVSMDNKRSVIQDIFDDWGVENVEEDCHTMTKVPDTVEIELKSLLDDSKTDQTVVEETVILVEEEITTVNKESIADTPSDITKSVEINKDEEELEVSKEKVINKNVKKHSNKNAITLLNKGQPKSPVTQNSGNSPKTIVKDSVTLKQTSQPHVVPVSRNRNLTSQIASKAKVAEAVKKRLREKQKVVELPRGPDIFFVKKLTQRLSSKLAGGPVCPMPALIPLPHSVQSSPSTEKKTNKNKNTEVQKESGSDNKELLAILEGDVDPDWSNLKPPTLTEEGKGPPDIDNSDNNTPPKLDPLVERELALKQLLELPVSAAKKNVSKKKKAYKSGSSKVSKGAEQKNAEGEKEEVSVDLTDSKEEAMAEDEVSDKNESLKILTDQENDQERERQQQGQELRLDESRSGRKRKPTEKAREHEQNTTKRQKMYKGKVPLGKKQTQENEVESSPIEITVSKESIVSTDTENNEGDVVIEKEISKKQFETKKDTTSEKPENVSVKRPKQSLAKKGSQRIAKGKILVKQMMRQSIKPNKLAVKLKPKVASPTKKPGPKILSKSQKRTSENISGDAKPKKKIINEIDRLLQDEGVVNLLYDVEQPDKKRLVPITKSQAKVMDLQKVQRELKIRKKLVRNAVLRLRTSTSGVAKVSPRSKRASVHLGIANVDKKHPDQITSAKPSSAAPEDFIFPAKIRNAADASVIIRRHSSSSFSSASGSPRVSIDGPEKFEAKEGEAGSHALRSTKRRHSQDERVNVKKSKKKKPDTEITIPDIIEDKVQPSARPNKKTDTKKADKSSKQIDTPITDDSNSTKVITRSNGTTTGKVTSKSKKSPKNKVTFAKASDSHNTEESSKEEDELSACLAEAANALSVVNAGNRSGNTSATRKNKGNTTTTAKIVDLDNNKTKSETQSQFSNKEITVRRHGNLVQLIFTPSSSTKIRNALTLQAMQEFREVLSILKKDDECRVVLLTSTGTSFCEGLELSMILHANKEERRLRVQEMADAVKDFIKCLASFNKPIVAGVQGAAVGLGVTMLPLFDLVIASDKATFSTPYGKLGQIAEGAAVYTLSHILGSAITSELLLGGRTLTASEALRAGLVTRVLWPDRFQVELLPTLKAMSEQSSQSMDATKALLRHSLRKKLDAALESETYLLIQHWCSAECQAAIKAYIEGKVD